MTESRSRSRRHRRGDPFGADRWDLRVETYAPEDELLDTVCRFVGPIVNRERFGDLEYRR